MAPEKEPSSSSQNSPEPRNLLYILLFAFGFLSGVFSSKARTPIHKSAQSGNPETEANEQRKDSPDEHGNAMASETNPPPAPPNKKKPYWYAKEFREWGMLTIEVIGVFGLFYYACTTVKMWHEMQEQTRIQRDAYISGQRPWMEITNVTSRGNSEIGGLSFSGFGHIPFPTARQTANMQLEISTKNIGHSVAELFVDFELFLPLWENQGPTAHGYSTGYANVVAAEKKRFCEESSKKEFPVKFMVFPEEPHVWDGGAQAIITPSVVNHLGNADVVLPVIIICANYRYPGSKDIFQTNALFEAFRNDNRSRFFTVGQNKPTGQFWLERNRGEDDAH